MYVTSASYPLDMSALRGPSKNVSKENPLFY